jgi:hypothetical protein
MSPSLPRIAGNKPILVWQGLPAPALLHEMAVAETVDAALESALNAGRLKLSPSYASLFVRLMDDQRVGHFVSPSRLFVSTKT